MNARSSTKMAMASFWKSFVLSENPLCHSKKESLAFWVASQVAYMCLEVLWLWIKSLSHARRAFPCILVSKMQLCFKHSWFMVAPSHAWWPPVRLQMQKSHDVCRVAVLFAGTFECKKTFFQKFVHFSVVNKVPDGWTSKAPSRTRPSNRILHLHALNARTFAGHKL